MIKKNNELVRLISSLNLESEEMPIEEYVQLAREGIVDVEYNMVELADSASGRGTHLGLDSNEEPVERNALDDQPNTNSQASSSPWVCPITIKFYSVTSFKFFSFKCYKHAIFYGQIKQDVNFQHQQASSKDNWYLLS